MSTLNSLETNLTGLTNTELTEISGGDWNAGFEAGNRHGYSAGKGIIAGLTIIGVWAFFL